MNTRVYTLLTDGTETLKLSSQNFQVESLPGRSAAILCQCSQRIPLLSVCAGSRDWLVPLEEVLEEAFEEVL